ncbi:ABC transporter permease [Teredinibacter haidensis]|uniref:ABC transporter permease n=1 Tax=Teredinibacter haidensis TaxID=2731755 RepID=UPI0009491B46|nr:ABC transporter permease [Teredinibacter haidensis]
MISFRRVFSVIHKEFMQLRRDTITFVMIIMIPLVQLLLFGYAINTDVRHIPVGVVDLSGNSDARFIEQAVIATQVVDITARYQTPKLAELAIVRGEIRAALVFPSDLNKRIAEQEILAQWLVDGSDTMVSSAVLQLRQMSLDQLIVEPQLKRNTHNPSFEVALFFNPTRRSAVNIVPGLTAVILTMTMILFTSTAIVRERERGNLELLITTPIRPIELMIGKIVPYIFVGLIQVSIILLLGRLVFAVPINGSLAHVYGATLLFIAASLTLGLIISTIATTQLQAMQMTVFVLLPSILLSGFMFPYEAMPVIAQRIAEVLPATHFMRMIRAIILRGAELPMLIYDSLWLVGFSILGLLVAALRFSKRLD